MKELRFGKSGAHMLDAAICLATSQDPWAEVVLCSLFDWPSRWAHYDHIVSVLLDEVGSFSMDQMLSPDQRIDHRIIIRFNGDVREGWVALP